MAAKQQTSSKPMMENKNVAGGRLAMFSNDPPTGHYRDGYCRTGPEDSGNHTVAATVTDKFLEFSAAKGNNLKDKGVKPGMKWCLCSTRWKEAFDAAVKGDLPKEHVPKVHLHATEESALKTVSYKDLKQYAADGEAPSEGSNTSRQTFHIKPEKAGSPASEAGSKKDG